jgi:hypothetical protein
MPCDDNKEEKGHMLEGILTQFILNQVFGAPLLNLSLGPSTSFVAMKRYIGNVFISFISCHWLIIKNNIYILWQEL